MRSVASDGLVFVSLLAGFAAEKAKEALAEPAHETAQDEEGHRHPDPNDVEAGIAVHVAEN